MQIERSDKHDPNAQGSKTVTEQPLSNATFDRTWQLLKQEVEIAVTDEGMQTSLIGRDVKPPPGNGVSEETGIENPLWPTALRGRKYPAIDG
jgi:hypothetical protein